VAAEQAVQVRAVDAGLARRGRDVVDIQTGHSVALPAPAFAENTRLVASDGAVLYEILPGNGRGETCVTLELRVPHDPAALQRWLVDVTNARRADGGHAPEWP
jgi:hypothetical protein